MKELNSRVSSVELTSIIATETLVEFPFGKIKLKILGKNALRGLPAKYPANAWGMHYRDEVGNISTSRASRDLEHVNLQIFTRFPIFGGWSHNWYNVLLWIKG